MKKNNKYDDILIEALKRYTELEFADIPPEDKIEYEFSRKYIKRKNKQLKKIEKPYWSYVNTAAKRAAIIIISLIFALSSLFTVDAVREKVVEFFYKIFDTHTSIYVPDESTYRTIIETNYTVPDIPNGYNLIFENCYELSTALSWINLKNQTIDFEQGLFKGSPNLDSEKAEVEEKIINDTPCLCVMQQTDYVFFWEFDGYSFTLIYPLDLGEEFAENVIGKLIEIEK